MGKGELKSRSAAGGGAAHSYPADLSNSVLQSALKPVHSGLVKTNPQSTPGEFSDYLKQLADPKNSAVGLADPDKKDWTYPLNAYFISSSHNTYLTGHQLYGESTTEGYINVLSRGCRCIEIDVWDGDDGQPQVYHGFTLTKEIKFKDVCESIGKYAFSKKEGERFEGAGEGPVIISLECHAGHEQQLKMVKIMEEAWGDMLVKDKEPEDVKELPSPEQLRRKIIVKAKYVPPGAEELAATAEQKLNIDSPSQAPPKRIETSSSSDSELEAAARAANQKKPKKPKVIRAFARLGAYCSSHHFPAAEPKPFCSHKTSQIPNHVYSFSEKVFAKHHEQHSQAIFEHNKNFLMRVYPFGLRFSSTNGDPTQFWRRGVQMVALNWQKLDEGMMLNEAMFAGEGGYVLKPEGFRPGDTRAPQYKHLDLKIHIIAGSNLPLPEEDDKPKGFNAYVKIEVYTAGEMEGEIKKKTKSKKGVHVEWNQKIEFLGVKDVIEGLTFVRFKVLDDEFGKDDLSSWCCVRLDRLREGVRVVRLFSPEGEHTKGVLVVGIEKKVY